jgi:ABC-type nitrate/sulfonate/bicarbonate transport system substrate-binding protein
MKRFLLLTAVSLLALTTAAISPVSAQQPTKITLMLDYTPNTNHLGAYVAQAKGFFKDENLAVEIVQPGDVQVEQLIAAGKVDFAFSYQEVTTFARVAGLPLVSVAAVIQHNTSGFAALRAKHPLKTPADLSGLKYGAFGSAVEKPMIELLMKCAKTPTKPVEFVEIGFAEPFPLMDQGRIDFVWLFYGWDGLRAKQQGIAVDFLMLKDYTDCVPDYYTPILITSEDYLKKNPAVVRSFVAAISKGYMSAITYPSEAAELFIKAVPETNAKLVRESAVWLAPQFQAEATRWGEQKLSIWDQYATWLITNKAMEAKTPFDAKSAFTNDFLPKE